MCSVYACSDAIAIITQQAKQQTMGSLYITVAVRVEDETNDGATSKQASNMVSLVLIMQNGQHSHMNVFLLQR